MDFLNQTLVTLWGYPLSLLETVGVLTGLISVILASRAWAVNFLFGIVNSLAYFVLCFEFRLYSMMLLQLVYLAFSIYGFYLWKNPKHAEADSNNELKIRKLSLREWFGWGTTILVVGFVWGWAVISLQARFPAYFDPPAYPWLDAVLTMGSVAGQWLLSKKIWDNWLLWIIIDAISTVMFITLGMVFTAVLYGIFTVIAVKALIDWKKIYETYER
jgi:nicotinamide mononucleotide transporter